MNEITILHVEGCAGTVGARAVVSELASTRADVTVIEALIENETEAIARGFRGSPTVLVNGRDVEADPQIPVGSMG
jgi:2-hydroxychromene-2-carboxylate isomerase